MKATSVTKQVDKPKYPRLAWNPPGSAIVWLQTSDTVGIMVLDETGEGREGSISHDLGPFLEPYPHSILLKND